MNSNKRSSIQNLQGGLTHPVLPFLKQILRLGPHCKKIWGNPKSAGLQDRGSAWRCHQDYNWDGKLHKNHAHTTIYGLPVRMDPIPAADDHPLMSRQKKARAAGKQLKASPTFTYLGRPLTGYRLSPKCLSPRLGQSFSLGPFDVPQNETSPPHVTFSQALFNNSFVYNGVRVVYCTGLERAQMLLAFSKTSCMVELDCDVLDLIVKRISMFACKSVPIDLIKNLPPPRPPKCDCTNPSWNCCQQRREDNMWKYRHRPGRTKFDLECMKILLKLE
jgi:hypothetical protein